METAQRLSDNGRYAELLKLMAELPKEQLTEKLLYLQAIAFIGTSRMEEARLLLHRLIAEDTQYPYVYLALAAVYEKLGEKEKAVYFYKIAARYRPTYREAQRRIESIGILDEIGEQTARVISIRPYKSDITFNDVVGLEKVKKRLFTKVVLPLKRADLYKEYNVEMGTGILLYGAPGNGKTYLARAIAGETNAYMMEVRQDQVLGEFFGVTEKNLLRIFDQARNNAPCIIFFDEFEVLAGKRSNYGGSDEHGGTSGLKMAVNSLLQQMDGMKKNPEGIFIIGATNRPWDIDPAVKRGGRMENSFYIPTPAYAERLQAFRYNLQGRKVSKAIDYNRLARATINYSQADIKKICRDAFDAPIAEKHLNGTDRPMAMGDLLSAIRESPNTVEQWYMNARKELIGSFDFEQVDSKWHRKWKSAKLEPQEMNEYKELIKDVIANTRTGTAVMNQARRLWSSYLF